MTERVMFDFHVYTILTFYYQYSRYINNQSEIKDIKTLCSCFILVFELRL